MQVAPADARSFKPVDGHHVIQQKPITKLQLFVAAYNWSMSVILFLVMLSQLMGIVDSTADSIYTASFGRQPSLGLYHIGNDNDEPYSDRAMVCVRHSRRYKAITINEALETSTIDNTAGIRLGGYRVVHRTKATIEPTIVSRFTRRCDLLNSTLNNILSACEALGYANLERDALRIVDGLDSKALSRIPNSLPILMIPHWDNCDYARYAIPAADGSVCMVNLSGAYNDVSSTGTLYAVNRSVRAAKMQEWIGEGVWKHGWLEDDEGMRWHADMWSTELNDSEGISARRFDTFSGHELHCDNQKNCANDVIQQRWGLSLVSTSVSLGSEAIVVSNGSRFGLFILRAKTIQSIQSVYNFSAFLSNVSVSLVLLRWMLTMFALQNGFRKGKTSLFTCGIGSTAHSSALNSLLITLLPQLVVNLAAFFTAGCNLFGDQKALADAWFVIYPAIIVIVLLCCSLLNIVARTCRRRMSDCTFVPTIVLLSLLHYFRHQISLWRWFQTPDATSAAISSDEFQQLTILDFFFTNAALRVNGNVAPLVHTKLIILSLNLLPLLFSTSMSQSSRLSKSHINCRIESRLVIRACNDGGIRWCSDVYQKHPKEPRDMMNAYELVRLGYIAFGGRFLMKWEDWVIITTLRPLRNVYHLWNHRITVFTLKSKSVSPRPQLLALDDPELEKLNWWDIDARAFV